MYQQDYQLMYTMTGLRNIYRTIAKLRSLRGEQIHSLGDSERRLIGWLMKGGYFRG